MRPRYAQSISLPLLALLLLQSCAPDEYAAGLSTLLNTYSQQVSRRLAEEEKRYRREAKILQDSDDRAQNMAVDEEIAATAVALEADIIAGRATGDRVVSNAIAFGRTEFERARQFDARAQDSDLQKIRTLQSLQMESAKIEGLRAALEVLAKKPNWQSALSESAQFGRDTKNRLDGLACGDLDGSVKQLTAQDTALTAEIAKETDAARKAALVKRQESVRASLTAAVAGRVETGHFDAATQTCK